MSRITSTQLKRWIELTFLSAELLDGCGLLIVSVPVFCSLSSVRCRGECPSSSVARTLAPLSTSSSTTAICPWVQANISAVCSLLLRTSMFALPCNDIDGDMGHSLYTSQSKKSQNDLNLVWRTLFAIVSDIAVFVLFNQFWTKSDIMQQQQ